MVVCMLQSNQAAAKQAQDAVLEESKEAEKGKLILALIVITVVRCHPITVF